MSELSEVRKRLQKFFGGEDYVIIARHFRDFHLDRDITGDVEDLLRFTSDPLTQAEAEARDSTYRDPAISPQRCIHCDPTFVPTGPDDYCYCICHDKELKF